MPGPLPDDYFRRGVFAGAAPGELFGSATCTICQARFKTFAAFRTHRTAALCRSQRRHAGKLQPGWAFGVVPREERDALTALLLQVPDPDPVDTAQWAEETLT